MIPDYKSRHRQYNNRRSLKPRKHNKVVNLPKSKFGTLLCYFEPSWTGAYYWTYLSISTTNPIKHKQKLN
jgi:hypothetical protein